MMPSVGIHEGDLRGKRRWVSRLRVLPTWTVCTWDLLYLRDHRLGVGVETNHMVGGSRWGKTNHMAEGRFPEPASNQHRDGQARPKQGKCGYSTPTDATT